MRSRLRYVALAGLIALLSARPAAACDTGPYTLYFKPGSAAIDAEGRDILDFEVRMFREVGGRGRISVTAHTDTVGSSDSNLGLSRSRAEAVRRYLMAKGMRSSRIILRSVGEAYPPTPTADERAERTNRVVTVNIEEGGCGG